VTHLDSIQIDCDSTSISLYSSRRNVASEADKYRSSI
jgi:hypothetical protein